MLTVLLPIKAVSVLNAREHWRARAARAKVHRATAYTLMRAAALGHEVPCAVTMTRIAPRALDGDNLQASAKACRDGIADWLKVNDNDPRVTWQYAQRRGEPKQYAVEIRVE